MEKTISNLQGKVEERSKHQTRMMEALNKNLRKCGQRSNATSATVAEQVSPVLLPSPHSHLPSAEPSTSQPPWMQDICPYQRCPRCQHNSFFNLWILQWTSHCLLLRGTHDLQSCLPRISTELHWASTTTTSSTIHHSRGSST